MGVWSAAHEQRPLLLLCAALVLLPLIMSLQGMSHYVHAYARFLISCVPLLFILIAEGIDWLARHLLRQRYAAVAAWGMSALLLYSWTPRIRDNFAATNRWPYRSAANFLHAEMQPKDVIVAEWGTGFNLSQFFDHFDDRIMLPAHYINKAAAKPDARTKGRVFYVTPSTTLEGRTAVIKRFGQMEITIYDGETPRILFEKWRTDLMARTGGRIARELQSDYEVLAVLEAHLQGGRSPEHWELVAARCREQESAARELPRQAGPRQARREREGCRGPARVSPVLRRESSQRSRQGERRQRLPGLRCGPW